MRRTSGSAAALLAAVLFTGTAAAYADQPPDSPSPAESPSPSGTPSPTATPPPSVAPSPVGTPPPSATPSPSGSPAGAAGSGPRLYAPEPNPDAYRQMYRLVWRGDFRGATGLRAMVRTPHAVWYGDQSPAEAERAVRETVEDADSQDELPVLALYNLPGRDCENYSGGGARDTEAYTKWVDAVARGIGDRRALVILEPDSLALLPSDCEQDDARGMRTAARYVEVGYAIDALEPLRRTRVYLDGGHPDWHSVKTVTSRLLRGGVQRATGFFLNVSHYQTDAANSWYGRLISSCIAYARGGGDPADCPDRDRPRQEAQSWLDKHVSAGPDRMKHFVSDTSRNGRGPWTPPPGKHPDPQDWCNPPDRGLGTRPTTDLADPLQDALLWVKTPGESDGLCLRGSVGPKDPERGIADPEAGHWFPQQALELVRFARPPVEKRRPDAERQP